MQYVYQLDGVGVRDGLAYSRSNLGLQDADERIGVLEVKSGSTQVPVQ
jgi:hypothetical protein